MPIVYITGDSTHEWSSKGVPDSVVLLKPFAPMQLSTTISTLITGPPTPAAPAAQAAAGRGWQDRS